MRPAPYPFTLRQAQYAVAVADLRSFRRAAELCRVSQPALSSQLAGLEEGIGARLFERDRRRVLPTPAGAEIVDRLRRLLVEADDLVDAARPLADPMTGALRLGILLADARVVAELNKVRLPYNVGSFSQVAAQIILENPVFLEGQIRMILAERGRLAAALSRLPGVTAFPSDANFILLRTDRPSRDVFDCVRRRGVLVRDLGGAPGMLHGCLRVTVGLPDENAAFLAAMGELFAR